MGKSKNYLFLTICLSTIVLIIFYRGVLLSPNSFLFNSYGDGIKNYYTCIYHVKNDPTWFQFHGMQYPTFEQVTFTDGQPALSNSIKLIAKVFPSVADYTIGIMNILMLFSLVICSVFVFLILIESGVGNLYSAFSSVCISFLSPQILRFMAHYGLSYCFVVPLAMYLILLIRKNNYNLRYLTAFFIYNTILFFIHPYLGILTTLLLFFDLLINSILFYKLQAKTNVLKQTILLLSPLLIFKIAMILTDKHTGRPENPPGIFEYNSNMTGVFLPNSSYLQPRLNLGLQKIGISPEQVSSEGLAYVGLATSFVLFLGLLAILLIPFIKRKKRPLPAFYSLFTNQQITWLIIGTCFLLLSFAYPFKWNTEIVYTVFPPFRQFRGLGRFAWVFYYVATLFSVSFVYKFYVYSRSKRYKGWIISYFFLFAVPASYLIESKPIHEYIIAAIDRKNLFDKKQLDDSYFEAIRYIDNSKYQAILPLPFYEIGSENYLIDPENKGTMLVSQLISYYSKLPIIGGASSRTSLEEAKNAVQLIAPAFYEKPILGKFPDTRHVLITFSKDQKLTSNEQDIYNQGKLIYDCNSFSILEISLNQLKFNTSDIEWENYRNIKKSLVFKNGFLTNDSTSIIYYHDYNDQPSDTTYMSNGAFRAPKKNFNVLAEFPVNEFKTGEEYLASLWLYTKGENVGHLFVCAEEFNPQTQKGAWNYYTDGRFSEVHDKDWARVEFKFKISDSKNSIKIFVKGQDHYNYNLYIDHLFVHKSGTMVYRELTNSKGQTLLFENNHFIHKL